MKRFAIIEGEKITNVILAKDGWVPPEGLTVIPELDAIAQGFKRKEPEVSFEDVMASARSAMANILDSLPLPDRMIVQPIRVSVEHALNLGQIDLAVYTIQNTVIPEHLDSVKQEILALFPH